MKKTKNIALLVLLLITSLTNAQQMYIGSGFGTATFDEYATSSGDNTFEVAAASLNQLFTVTGDGSLTIGIQVKYSDNSPRTYSTNRSGRGGLQVIIYR